MKPANFIPKQDRKELNDFFNLSDRHKRDKTDIKGITDNEIKSINEKIVNIRNLDYRTLSLQDKFLHFRILTQINNGNKYLNQSKLTKEENSTLNDTAILIWRILLSFILITWGLLSLLGGKYLLTGTLFITSGLLISPLLEKVIGLIGKPELQFKLTSFIAFVLSVLVFVSGWTSYYNDPEYLRLKAEEANKLAKSQSEAAVLSEKKESESKSKEIEKQKKQEQAEKERLQKEEEEKVEKEQDDKIANGIEITVIQREEIIIKNNSGTDISLHNLGINTNPFGTKSIDLVGEYVIPQGSYLEGLRKNYIQPNKSLSISIPNLVSYANNEKSFIPDNTRVNNVNLHIVYKDSNAKYGVGEFSRTYSIK